MQNSLKQYIGGISISLSVLLLLIGLKYHTELFEQDKREMAQISQYVRTDILHQNKKISKKIYTFNINNKGDLIKKQNINNQIIINHYRAIYIPTLVNNYEDIPQIYLEIIKNNQKQWVPARIYKTNRQEGLVYFLLKTEKNGLINYTNLYTGRYKVELID